MTARERYSRSVSRPAHEVSTRPSPEARRGHRRPLTLACVLACAAALSIPLAPTSHAQNAQRGAIQTPGGGRGPGAAPDASDPANAGADLSPKPPVLPLSPEEEAKRLSLPPGYRMAPVLSDPLIEDPAQIAFDGNGRMFVVELRGYFQTPEGIDLIPPVGRISLHEDRDNDGVFERHSVFVDKLVFPRFVLPFGANTILTMETNADEVWKYTDTNGDGVADKRELFVTGFGRAGNMESQQASLFWAMDNWLYSTVNAFRLRWTPNGIVKEPTGPNSSQWGVTQDNDGKVWFQGGASGVPGYFQFPVHYGNFAPPDQFEPDLNIVWGAPIRIGDIQAGLPGTRMPDGSLVYATAAAGNEVYRGDRLPKDLAGDYLHGEVVARIVRRLRPVKTEGLTRLRNVYPGSEFIRSLDPLFRPADVTTGPDGTIYIADMYRGMIEGAEWAKQGTYLREKISQYQLDKVVGHGRVWRLTYDGIARDRTRPRMLEETPAQLVAHLAHPNGWWRDTAQQLLVLKQDRSVVPALQSLVRTSKNLLARFHALWTLEGLGALDASLTRVLLRDLEPRMRIQALRASETLYKSGDRSFDADYRSLSKDSDVDVVIQAMLAMHVLKVADASSVVKTVAENSKARGVQFVAERIATASATAAGRGAGRGGALTEEQQGSLERGSVIYTELCYACHGGDGRGAPTPGASAGATLAPSLAGSPRVNGHRDYVIKSVLHGLSGPLDGRSYPQVMVAMGTNSDQWIADITSYVRNSFGNIGALATPADVARVRTATGTRSPWTAGELEASLPRALVPDPSWKVTASHDGRPSPQANAEGGYNYLGNAAGALSFLGWTTGVPQQPGMWFQIELPAPATLAEIQFTSSSIGGRAGAPVAWTFPRGYEVQVSADGKTWSAPVAQGQGSPGITVIPLTPVSAKFVRITQTASVDNAPPWAMRLVRLYVAAPGK
jgi:mono/diheme cytochrome c family protein/glucose/arabinose dehydrogenase